jgi:hypothetical protein
VAVTFTSRPSPLPPVFVPIHNLPRCVVIRADSIRNTDTTHIWCPVVCLIVYVFVYLAGIHKYNTLIVYITLKWRHVSAYKIAIIRPYTNDQRNHWVLHWMVVCLFVCLFDGLFDWLIVSLAVQPSTGYGLVTWGFVITHNDAPQSIGLLWTSDLLVAEISTSQHTQQTNIHTRRDSNPRSQQASGLRPRGHWDQRLVSSMLFFPVMCTIYEQLLAIINCLGHFSECLALENRVFITIKKRLPSPVWNVEATCCVGRMARGKEVVTELKQ